MHKRLDEHGEVIQMAMGYEEWRALREPHGYAFSTRGLAETDVGVSAARVGRRFGDVHRSRHGPIDLMALGAQEKWADPAPEPPGSATENHIAPRRVLAGRRSRSPGVGSMVPSLAAARIASRHAPSARPRWRALPAVGSALRVRCPLSRRH